MLITVETLSQIKVYRIIFWK